MNNISSSKWLLEKIYHRLTFAWNGLATCSSPILYTLNLRFLIQADKLDFDVKILPLCVYSLINEYTLNNNKIQDINEKSTKV